MFVFLLGGYCIMDDQLFDAIERLLLRKIMFDMQLGWPIPKKTQQNFLWQLL